MYLYKINNFKQVTGNLDYKGLDLSQIVAGSQVYPHSFEENNICLIGSLESHQHEDLVHLSEEEYVKEKEEIESQYPIVEDENDKLDRLEKENIELKEAMADLAEQQMLADIENKMALADLAESMTGGE